MADEYAPSGATTEVAKPTAAPVDDQALYDLLDRKHPDYEAAAEKWRVYRDVLGEEDVDKSKYLPRNELEWQEQYAFRLAISEFIPETPLAVQRLVSGLYRQKPSREFKKDRNSAELKAFADNATLDGDDMNKFMPRAIKQLAGYGSTRILVNMHMPDDMVPGTQTRAEEQQAGVRPYCVLYNPLSVIDWDFDERGRMTMVRIKETRHAKEDPTDPLSPCVKICRFIHYDTRKIEWWDFKEVEGKKVKLKHQRRDNPLGIVPMIVHYWPERVRPMVGAAYIRLMARADVAKFRSESDLDYDTFVHAHPTLKLWTDDDVDEKGVGSGALMKLRPGNIGEQREDAAYLETPSSAFQALDGVIDSKRAAIYRHSGIDPMGVLDQGAVSQVSGVSRAWSFGTSEATLLSELADAAVNIEHEIYEMVLRYYDTGGTADANAKVFKGEVQYPEEFDVSTSSKLLEEIERSGPIINSPTLQRTLQKRFAASKVGDSTADLLEEIQEEIDKLPLIGTNAGRQQDILSFPKGVTGPTTEEDAAEEETA